MTLTVKMIPSVSSFDKQESGIRRVVEAYTRLGPQFGIRYVGEDELTYDLLAVHAGLTTRFDPRKPLISHLHGVYWTADYPAASWEWRANRDVIESIRYATEITVPSEWVAESLRRDMHIRPAVIHHGIAAPEWDHALPNEGFVLWNKNRAADVCDPRPMLDLATMRSHIRFMTTFSSEKNAPRNVHTTGVRTHTDMKRLIQQAGVYLSTTKETFGIGVLEALAAGTPVLGFAHGGNLILVKHGVNGFLARPGDISGLVDGLDYCLQHRDILSENAKKTVGEFTWEAAVEKVAKVYHRAMDRFAERQRPFVIDDSLFKVGINAE